MGLDETKTGRPATPDELADLKRLLNEAMDAGGCGWSAQRLPFGNQRDFDGTPMPTDRLPDETALALAEVLGDRDEGFIQMTYNTNNPKADASHYEELARVSGRPIIYNAVQPNDTYPERHRQALKWIDSCRQRGLPVYAQGVTTAAGFTMTFEEWNLFDDADAWMDATTGTFEERLQKLSDPERRPALREESLIIEKGSTSGPFAKITVLKTIDPELKHYENLLLGEIADQEGKHVVDAMLDLAVADNLQTVFYMQVADELDLIKDILDYPFAILGVSDGGAHTKFFTAGRYPTESIIRFVRDNDLLSLEEVHWRLSALPAYCAGFRDRGTLREGAPADVVIYKLDELAIGEMEVVEDLPGGEWRRVQRAYGYRYILVNGEPTFVDGKPTGALPGSLLRHGGG